MNKERVLLIIIAMIGVYLAGYYQITPVYLYSLTGKASPVSQQPSTQIPTQNKPAQAITTDKGVSPTPWPPPPPEVQR